MNVAPFPRPPAPPATKPAEEAGSRAAETELLTPEAYLHTVGGGRPARLPIVRPWALGLLLAVLLLAAVSFPLWWDAVGELNRLLTDILGAGA